MIKLYTCAHTHTLTHTHRHSFPFPEIHGSQMIRWSSINTTTLKELVLGGKWKWKVLDAQSCLTLCHCMDCSSSVHGMPQTGILEWVVIPFSRRSSQPRDQTQVSWIASRFFTIWVTSQSPKNECTLHFCHLFFSSHHIHFFFFSGLSLPSHFYNYLFSFSYQCKQLGMVVVVVQLLSCVWLLQPHGL